VIANAHQREVRLELVLIELYAGGGHRVANPLRERDESLLRLRTHPTHPRVPAIREEAAAAQHPFECAAAVDANLVHDGLLLLAEKRECHVLTLCTHPRGARKLGFQFLQTFVQRTENLRRKRRRNEEPHFGRREA